MFLPPVQELIAMDQAGGKYKGGSSGDTSNYKYNKEKEVELLRT